MPTPNGWMTAKEASDLLGVTIQRVHQLAVTYGVETMPVSPRLKLFSQRDIKKLASTDRPTGVHASR